MKHAHAMRSPAVVIRWPALPWSDFRCSPCYPMRTPFLISIPAMATLRSGFDIKGSEVSYDRFTVFLGHRRDRRSELLWILLPGSGRLQQCRPLHQGEKLL